MNDLSEKINERINVLESLIREKKKAIEKAPQGIIHVVHSKKRVQYYRKMNEGNKKKKYIRKSEEGLIRALCQKDYDKKVLSAAEKEYTRLKMLHNLYKKGMCEDIYESLTMDRQGLVSPIALPEDEFIAQWLQQSYPRKGFAPDTPEYYTENGERVRSKSEILIANTLKRNNIPYRYEAPLYLSGVGTIHPDFTVLNVKERKEYYWEHLGKMDDPEYIERALQRIDSYGKNNIFPGDKLILSHETLAHPINLRNVERMIFQYLK